ncbi:MAG: thioesterase domain-containing protein, partial [Actinomycetota bacterium]
HEGCLSLTWSYCQQRHRRASIEALARRYLDALGALIEHCCSPAPHLVALTPAPTDGQTPLFLVHPVGAGVSCYLDLAESLREQAPIVGLQPLLGEVPSTIEAMATQYLEAILSFRPRGPYRLGGWSLGGLIAFEMARQFEDRGLDVDALVIIDISPPGLASGASEGRPEKWSVSELSGDLLHDFLAEVGLLETRLSDENLAVLERLVKAQRKAVETYVPGAYNGSAMLFVAQLSVDGGGVAPRTAGHDAWRHLIRGEILEHTIAADHFTIVRGANARLIAKYLRSTFRSPSKPSR